jgi:hypothetical protein
VGKALLVGDRSERDEDDIGFDSFVDRDRVDARIEFGAARIGDEDGNGLRGKEAGERRAHQPRAYDGVRHAELHMDRCRKFS